MRVLCVDADAWPSHVPLSLGTETSVIKDGEVYHVVNQKYFMGALWYELAEDPTNGYYSKCFVRLSDEEMAEVKDSVYEKEAA